MFPPLNGSKQEIRGFPPCPYGAIGDQLWVKETYRSWKRFDFDKPINIPEGAPIFFEADENTISKGLFTARIRQSIFMRHWMSRLTLEITNVRVERLNEISEEDAIAEGVRCRCMSSAITVAPSVAYYELWDSINGPGSWDQNPWVWAITFKIITQ